MNKLTPPPMTTDKEIQEKVATAFPIRPGHYSGTAKAYERDNGAEHTTTLTFTAGADVVQQHYQAELQQLVEDYERRLKDLETSTLLSDTYTKGRRHSFHSIIADLKRIINPAKNDSNEPISDTER